MRNNSPRLEAYLKADRVWRREHRIKFARLMLRLETHKGNTEEVAFWGSVLDANGVVKDRMGKGSRVLPSTSFALEKSLR